MKFEIEIEENTCKIVAEAECVVLLDFRAESCGSLKLADKCETEKEKARI